MFLHAENLFFLFSLQLVDISIFYVYAVCYILWISVLSSVRNILFLVEQRPDYRRETNRIS